MKYPLFSDFITLGCNYLWAMNTEGAQSGGIKCGEEAGETCRYNSVFVTHEEGVLSCRREHSKGNATSMIN